MTNSTGPLAKTALVIGGGPAGLMAAETLAGAGVRVQLYDAMPSVGRKFLLAGKGGLNLTHSEPAELFASRFGARQAAVAPWLAQLDAAGLRDWAKALGVDTYVGSSGRVFPVDMKSAPLLRAWLHRLREAGVAFHMRHKWTGFEGQACRFESPKGPVLAQADVVLLALGGASWARLGSDGAWVPVLAAEGVAVAPLVPANCGFDVGQPPDEVANAADHANHADDLANPADHPGQAAPGRPSCGWSDHFASRYAGQPFKTVAIACTGPRGEAFHRQGEFVATATGVEGSLVYAASALLRDAIAVNGHAHFLLDLLPDRSAERVLADVAHPRGSRSLSSHLKSRLGLDGIKLGVLHERLGKAQMNDPVQLATAIKALPIHLVAPRPIDEAISTAGGVRFDALSAQAMLLARPGVFCAGEMVDWEAPTGGYLLTACMASGRAAGQGAIAFLQA